ncbi:hypothetical protein ACHQM5_018482 [Ranunculus cassubicifolius]
MFDPAIKLFGKTIPLPDNQHQVLFFLISIKTANASSSETTKSSETSSTEEDHTADGQEKLLKKPDKIVPCPRCNSLETKFCYYNNYNVNQPRHFCKNCQRYWTAGGTMRNVPVGAGRRKTKHIIASHYHRHAAMVVSSDDGENGSVVEFGADAPLCESMATVLNLADKKRKTDGESGEEPSSCGSSVSASTCSNIRMPGNVVRVEEHGVTVSDGPRPLPQNPLQCYTCPPWMYPWSAGWNSMAAMATGRCSSEMFYRMDSGDLRQVQWGSTPMVVPPTFCPPGMPFQFMPSSYWGGAWASGAWSMPWSGSNGPQSPSSSSAQSGCSSNHSPTLGKHSRDSNMQVEDKTEKCLWAPKTLRIDDPDAIAKSSIWATLGVNPCRSEPILKGGIFKAFQPKTDVNCSVSDTTVVLQANPAALSRSQTFQEST